VTGMGTMMFAVFLGLGNALLAHPLVLEILTWGGAAMLCWMAWRIATAGHAETTANAPAGYLGMAAFQWVNPKGWLIGIAAIATFLDRRAGGALAQATIYAILFTLVAFPSCLLWLAFGAGLQRFLRTPRAWRVFNGAMAALLAAATILLVCTRF
jgi:threonine/homoserine/homoserine lactone efflux protein